MRKVHETSAIGQPLTIPSTRSFRLTLIVFLSTYSFAVASFALVLLSHQFHFAPSPSIFVMELHTLAPSLCRVSSLISLAPDCARCLDVLDLFASIEPFFIFP